MSERLVPLSDARNAVDWSDTNCIDRVYAREREAGVWQALEQARLSPREREAIERVLREDMTLEEVGERMGIGAYQVRNLLCHVRQKLARPSLRLRGLIEEAEELVWAHAPARSPAA
jgi:RNA polymerase sigma factor (sigma-70 family)